jgi:hypothetical protein
MSRNVYITCPACGQRMHVDGVQHNPVAGTKFDVATCLNEACERFEYTYTYNERPMTAAEMKRYAGMFGERTA